MSEKSDVSQELLESFARGYGLSASTGYIAPPNAKLINYHERKVEFTDESFSTCGIYDKGKITAVVDLARNFCTCNEMQCSHRQDAIGAAYRLIQTHQNFDAETWQRKCSEAHR